MKQTVNYNGEQVEAEEVKCTPSNPDLEWIEFNIQEDDVILKIKPVIVSVLRLDKKDQQTGLYEYLVKTQNIVTVVTKKAK